MEQACIRCGSLHVRRHDMRAYREMDVTGVHWKSYQRWWRVDRRHAFIPERNQRPDASPYSQAIREKATILYVETGASYRAVVRELAHYGFMDWTRRNYGPGSKSWRRSVQILLRSATDSSPRGPVGCRWMETFFRGWMTNRF